MCVFLSLIICLTLSKCHNYKITNSLLLLHHDLSLPMSSLHTQT